MPTLGIALALTLPCAAQPLEDRPRLTGQQLVDLMAMPPGAMNILQLTARQQRDHKVAQAYIDGVLDASRGITWCSNGRWKPDTLDEKVIWGLRALPPESLKRPAAPIIVEILSGLLPCSNKK